MTLATRINRIAIYSVGINKNAIRQAGEQKISDVAVRHADDQNIDEYEINGRQFHSYLLVVSNPKRVRVGFTKFDQNDDMYLARITADGLADRIYCGSPLENRWRQTILENPVDPRFIPFRYS